MKINKTTILILGIATVAVLLLVVQFFTRQKNRPSKEVQPIKKMEVSTNPSSSPVQNNFKVVGYSPASSTLTDLRKSLEVQFSSPPGNIIVETDPKVGIEVSTYKLKVGGYIIVVPSNHWIDNTTQKIIIKLGSTSDSGQVLTSDYVISYQVKEYKGL